MKHFAEIVEKTVVKDKYGNVTTGQETYNLVKTIKIYDILPYSSQNASKDFGFTEKTTHKTNTFDDVSANSFLRFKGNIYKINEVATFPKSKTLILELM